MSEDQAQAKGIDKKLGELNHLLRYRIVLQSYVMGATFGLADHEEDGCFAARERN